MSLQWTVVAVVLYMEVFVVALFLLPWIRPSMWNKFFKSRMMSALSNYAHVYSWAGFGILMLLFFDAVREVRKYSSTDLLADSTIMNANADAVVHMRLFRAQRNLYISGFTLFLWLVIRRLMSVIGHEAQLQASADAALKQAQGATDVAKQMMDSQGGDESKLVTGLKETIQTLEEELKKTKKDRDAMKTQSENLRNEYDRLSDEYNKLENETNKKDD